MPHGFQRLDVLVADAVGRCGHLIQVAVPRFGQLLVDVTQQHYRRAMTKLAEIMTYDNRRAPNVPGMFEYNVNLQRLYDNQEELVELIIELRLKILAVVAVH